MAGYDYKIQYLKCKDNVCADLLSRAVNGSKNNGDPSVYIDRNYIISAINSNLFEPKGLTLAEKVEDPAITYKRP